ncbi:MAG: glycosyltransferase family 2 protein [Thermoplasmata archaeon]|nr:glycosyltransferase family 2 protein [Thermoplasmata archaeon]
MGATFQQMPFNEIVMSGRDITGSAFLLGSGFIARVSALKDVNYFDESAVTEDLATSLELHSLGYKPFYVNYPGI